VLGQDAFDDLVRKRPIADEVAQAVHGVMGPAAKVLQHGVERREVSVDVADDGDGHAHGIRSRSRLGQIVRLSMFRRTGLPAQSLRVVQAWPGKNTRP
jgi:hypothetical protein